MGNIRVIVCEVKKAEIGYEEIHTVISYDQKVIAKFLRALADTYDPVAANKRDMRTSDG